MKKPFFLIQTDSNCVEALQMCSVQKVMCWSQTIMDHYEGPLWKQGCTDLLMLIPAIFNWGYF